MATTKYPFAPLAKAMCMTEAQACRELGISGSTQQEYRSVGMSEKVADRMAVKAGLHAFDIWPEMVEHAIADELEARRRASRERKRRQRRNEAVRQRESERQKRYYAECREALKAAERRRYWADPERHRERKRQGRAG